MNKRQFLLLSAGVVLTAFALREWYVLASVLPNPTQGDVSSYLRYAQHMVLDGVFSQAENGAAVVPDAYRTPGYPLILAAIYRFTGMSGWFSAVYQVQVVIGALTVAGVIALARQWLPCKWAVLAGALLAVWPHHIAATNAMLTEVVFAFALIGSLLLASLALSRRSLWLAVAAGAAFGVAYLVNPVIALFPAALLAVFWRARAAKLGAVVLAVSLVAVVGWGVRNTLQDAHGDSRVWQNLVQGAWPGYHHAEKWWPWIAEDRAVRAGIAAEMEVTTTDHAAGLRMIGARMASDPVRYARWYALEKPYLLWDWDVRMGQGGVYTLEVWNSPLDRGLMLAPTILLWALNPALFALAIGGVLLAFRGKPSEQMVALFFVYITALHVVLQAEPRYAIAYRPIEILMIAGAGLWIRERARGWRVARSRVRRDAFANPELIDVAPVPEG